MPVCITDKDVLDDERSLEREEGSEREREGRKGAEEKRRWHSGYQETLRYSQRQYPTQ